MPRRSLIYTMLTILITTTGTAAYSGTFRPLDSSRAIINTPDIMLIPTSDDKDAQSSEAVWTLTYLCNSQTKSYYCQESTPCLWCPSANDVYFIPCGVPVTFPAIPVTINGDTFSGTIGIEGHIGAFLIYDVVATLNGEYDGVTASWELILSGLADYRFDWWVFDYLTPFVCTLTVTGGTFQDGLATGEYTSHFYIHTDTANCILLEYDELSYGPASAVVEGKPAAPWIWEALDPGTGDQLFMRFWHIDPSEVVEYQCYLREPGETWLPFGPRITEDGTGMYEFTFSELTELTRYELGVSAIGPVGESEITSDGPLRPSVPLFLVHGLNDADISWMWFELWLSDDGFNHVHAVNTIAPCGVPGEEYYGGNAERLAIFVENKLLELEDETGIEVPAIDIIGHSMGGLISRRYNAPESAGDFVQRSVRKLIMLATPNEGSQLSDYPGSVWACASGPAVEELRAINMILFNALYSDNSGTWHYVFWGSNGLAPSCYVAGLTGYLMLSWPNDGAVAKESAIGTTYSDTPMFPNNWGRSFPPLWCHPDFFSDEWFYTEKLFPLLSSVSMPSAPSFEPDDPSIPPQLTCRYFAEVEAGQSVVGNFNVEPSESLFVAISTASMNVNLSLQSPQAGIVDSVTAEGDPGIDFYSDGAGLKGFRIVGPEPGQWSWSVLAGAADKQVIEFAVLASSPNGLVANGSLSPSVVGQGDTLRVRASLHEDGSPITDADISAILVFNGTDTLILPALLDDGDTDDGVAANGVYGNIVADFGIGGSAEVALRVSGTASWGSFQRYLN